MDKAYHAGKAIPSNKDGELVVVGVHLQVFTAKSRVYERNPAIGVKGNA